MAYTKYSLTPANNNAAPPDGAPEGMLPSAVNDTMRDMMAQIRDCGDGIRDGTYTMTAAKITGGSITGVTFSSSAATITGGSVTGVTFSSSSATITGGSITGITDLAVADGGTGASTAANARTNLSAAASGANSDITSLTGLTTPLSQAQGGTGTTTGYYGFKNRIINGAMLVNQRGGTVTGNDSAYSLDRWKASCVPDGKFTMQQSSTAPTGFINSMLVTSTSAYSVASSDFIGIRQDIEGLNCTDLAWGTAQAKTITLSFQVYSSLTGNFGGSLFNNAGNRSYPFSYTISSANTWTTVSVTIAGDTSGTWLTTNGRGICVFFSLGSGSSNSGTANAWAGSFLAQPTGSTSVVGTNGATFYITGVQLEVGSTATSFDYRPYTTELSLCYRYCYALYKGDNIYYATAGYYTSTDVRTQIQMPVNMRTTPTISYTGYSQLWRNGTSDANNVNGWSVTLSCPNTVHLTSTNSMSGTAGQIGWLYSGGTSQLIFLAEL